MEHDAPRPIAGIVLAGGLSSRMGRDKALLPWHGRPLLAHMRELLLAAGAQPVVVSGDYPTYGGVPDRVAQRGPLGGLEAAIARLPDGPAWVVPVDMPRLTVALLARLRDASGACAIFAGQPLPMRLEIDAGCRARIAAMIGDPDGPQSLKALQRALGTVELPVPAGSAHDLANCNTPAEWEDIAS